MKSQELKGCFRRFGAFQSAFFTFSQSSTVFLTPVLYPGGVVLDVEEVGLPQHRHQADGEQQVEPEGERRPQGALFEKKFREIASLSVFKHV